jgi:medium-chain acyl-[acyl-carrier-protein] hydrolase
MTNNLSKDRWIIRTRPNPQARLRLFCFPYAGSGSSTFATWGRNLPVQVEVCAIQLPGRENRLAEPPYTSIAPLAEALEEALRPYLDKPFAVFGHSNGALIGFEFIRQLRRLGRPQPLQFFPSGCRAPQLPSSEPPIYNLPDAEFIDEIRRANGTPEEIFKHEELMKLVLPLLRADYTMHDLYAYTDEGPLDCPIAAFAGHDDPLATGDQTAAWRTQTRGEFKFHVLPGDHFFIRSASSLLLRYLSEYLSMRTR